MSKKSFVSLLVFALALALSVPAFAQEATPEMEGPPGAIELPPPPPGAEVLAQGLNYPRQFDLVDGSLFVPEVGVGGPIVVQGPEGEVGFGYSSQVVTIAPDGTVTPIVTNLPSAAGQGGAADVEVTEDAIWVVTNGVGPAGAPPFLAGGAYRFDRADGHLEVYVDLFGFEAANNPDANAIDSNPTDVEVIDGTVYIVDTGANTLYTWSADAGLEPLVVWPENPVPTAVVGGPDGNLYVSFLGTEIAPGAGMVQKISPEGEILETFAGYNALTDLVVAEDGTPYAVSLFSGFGEAGPLPGQIVRVTADEGGEVVVDNLLLPYGIALDENGNLVVSTGATFLPPGTGQILRIPLDM